MTSPDPSRRVAILQPGYLPWLGFFEQMYRSDVFVFLDDVQFTKNDWRNRNRIKTKTGVQWLTVPVIHSFGQKIKDTAVDMRSPWQKKHLQSLRMSYGRSRFFNDLIGELEGLYTREWRFLLDIDREICLLMMRWLGISCEIVHSSDLGIVSEDRQMRLIEICRSLGGGIFYEGKSGQNYMDTDLFEHHGVTVEFQEYSHPYYEQLWMKEQGFISHLSAIDLLFNHGPDSLGILCGQRVFVPPEGLDIRHADDA